MKKLLCFVVVAFLCGCAGFREGNISSINTFPQPDKKPSINITLDFIVNMNGNTNLFLAALTGATFYIFPSYSKDTNVITAQLINNKNKHQAEIVLNDSMTMWQQILLLPLTPFKHPLAEAVSMQNDLIDNLALQTYENIKNRIT